MDGYGVDVGVEAVVANSPDAGYYLSGFESGAGPMVALAGWRALGETRLGVSARYRYTTYGIIAPRASRPGGSDHPQIHEVDALANVEFLSNGSGPRLSIGWSWNWANNVLSRFPTDRYSGYHGPMMGAGYVASLSQPYGVALTLGIDCTYLLSFETPLLHASVGVRKSWGL
jgi:hypothetical protein